MPHSDKYERVAKWEALNRGLPFLLGHTSVISGMNRKGKDEKRTIKRSAVCLVALVQPSHFHRIQGTLLGFACSREHLS